MFDVAMQWRGKVRVKIQQPLKAAYPLKPHTGVRYRTGVSSYKNVKKGRFRAGDATQKSVLFVCLWNKMQPREKEEGNLHQNISMNYSLPLAMTCGGVGAAFWGSHYHRCSCVCLPSSFFFSFCPSLKNALLKSVFYLMITVQPSKWLPMLRFHFLNQCALTQWPTKHLH